jgi:hypothetical protein
MPLLDLFHNQDDPLMIWSSFHAAWVPMMTQWLNQHLPRRYRARSNVIFGGGIGTDVAEYDRGEPDPTATNGATNGGGNGGVAVATWAPPRTTATIDIAFPDDLEVRVFDTRNGANLVAVIELVSPSNKDREGERLGFAAKCAAYLQRGLGLVVIDTITNRNARLFASLLELLGRRVEDVAPNPPELHAASYRPVQREERSELDIWLQPLTIGAVLPTVPLPLRGAGIFPLDLETTYTRAREIDDY